MRGIKKEIVVLKECLLLCTCVWVCVCVTKGGPASVFTLEAPFGVLSVLDDSR